MTERPLSAADLGPLLLCVVAALGAHLGSAPAWVLLSAAAAGLLRLALAALGRGAPPMAVRLPLVLTGVVALLIHFETFNGLAAGTSLLALMTGMKFIESSSRRDVYVLTLLVYFLAVAALLMNDNFWLLSYAVAVCWATSAVLLRLMSEPPRPTWATSARYMSRIVLQALPLALVFWVLFPRFGGPLWQLPSEGQTAFTGLGDTMTPGDIAELANSDDIAFRVRFKNAAPPPTERYWRGPALHDFDGRTWKRGYPVGFRPPTLHPLGPAYTYSMHIEPQSHDWVYTLDWPTQWDLPQGMLGSDYTLMQATPSTRPLDLTATSHTHVEPIDPLSAYARRRDLSLPAARNPRTVALAQSLRSRYPADADYVGAVLQLFKQQPFFYTLRPPRLPLDSIDAFLFDTRRGFCGHYASAFAVLMRAAGIPTRIVTGYQGGAFNRFSNYWIVRQNEAHAWDEIWLEGHGWVRVDPTGAIAPERVSLGAARLQGYSADWRGSSWFVDLRLRLDALRQLWRERIVLFDQISQQGLLEALHIPNPDVEKLVMLLAAALTVALAALTWSVRGELRLRPKDPLLAAYARLCRKLARAGVPRRADEGAEAFAARIDAARPDLGAEVSALCRDYSRLRYEASRDMQGVKRFAQRVRALRAATLTQRGSRASLKT